MELEIEGRHKNVLLHREELNFEILDAKQTPTRKEIRTKLAGMLGVEEGLVIIDEIEHEFGSSRVVGFAKKYDSVEEMKKTEPTYMRKKHGEKAEEKKGEEAKEEKPPAPAKE